MSPDASFLPPGLTPPTPPVVRLLAYAFSVLMSLALLLLIGIIFFDFGLEMVGMPLYPSLPKAPPNSFAEKQNLPSGLPGSVVIPPPAADTGNNTDTAPAAEKKTPPPVAEQPPLRVPDK